MVSLRSRSSLSATDEFWHSPIATFSKAALGDSDEGNDHDCTMTLPAAHHQLLSADQTSFENLKGYDHNQDVVSYDSLDIDDGYSSCRQKLSAVKQQGGGSWLLGFARLNNNDKSLSPEDSDDDDEQALPGLVRDDSSLDDDSSSDTDSESDDDSSLTSESAPTKISSSPNKKRGISFNATVTIQPIPHSSTLTPLQRRKMYSTSWEVRQNKIRNKKEYRYDGYDWRNVTEEWEMGVDMVTGELVHPAHDM